MYICIHYVYLDRLVIRYVSICLCSVEAAMLRDLSEVIKAQLGLEQLEISEEQRDNASPGKPQIVFS